MTDLPPLDDALRNALTMRLKIALRAAEQAGAVLLRWYGHLGGYEQKSAIDLVTDADREAEAVLLAELRSAFPRDAFLAEEADGNAGSEAMRARGAEVPFCWVVDPLDGTTNFAHSHLSFCVSVGLLHHGRPCLGVVLAPLRREIFVGGWGLPATCNDRAIRVSEVDDLSRALLATGFPYDRRERLPQLLDWVGRALMKAHDIRRCGSAALDLCEVAAGRVDGFWEIGLKPWDTVAGEAIVHSAGGLVTNLDGGGHDPFGARTLASNRRIHAQLVDLLA